MQNKYELVPQVDNRGSPFNGQSQGFLWGTVNSPFGRQGQIGARIVGASRLQFFQVAYQEQIGTEGLKLDTTVLGSQGQPEGNVLNLPFEADTEALTWVTTLSYPLIRSRIRNLSLRLAFDFHNDRREQQGFPDTFEDRIRSLRFGVTYDMVDRWRGLNLLDLELSQGLNILDATTPGSPNLSRLEGRSNYTKLDLYLARRQLLPRGWSLLAAINAQYSADPLLAYEQFGFGGTQFGRGYDPSEILGDSGLAGKLELSYTGQASYPFPFEFTPYGFYDVGSVWRRATLGGLESRESRSSAGVGVRFVLPHDIELYLEIAKPFDEVISEGNADPRLYGGMRIALYSN